MQWRSQKFIPGEQIFWPQMPSFPSSFPSLSSFPSSTFPLPLCFSSISTPPLPSFPLEVSRLPSLQLRGMGECLKIKLPKWVWAEPGRQTPSGAFSGYLDAICIVWTQRKRPVYNHWGERNSPPTPIGFARITEVVLVSPGEAVAPFAPLVKCTLLPWKFHDQCHRKTAILPTDSRL